MAKTNRNHDKPGYWWFTNDWRGCMELRLCSLAARGLWREMLDIMNTDANPYGTLRPGGTTITVEELAVMIGRPIEEVKPAFEELERRGIFSRDKDGVPYCRKSVRSWADREKKRKAAKKRWAAHADAYPSAYPDAHASACASACADAYPGACASACADACASGYAHQGGDDDVDDAEANEIAMDAGYSEWKGLFRSKWPGIWGSQRELTWRRHYCRARDEIRSLLATRSTQSAIAVAKIYDNAEQVLSAYFAGCEEIGSLGPPWQILHASNIVAWCYTLTDEYKETFGRWNHD